MGLNILWNIHLYPPYHCCGSEFYAHHINKFLISKGHQVRVVLNQAAQNKIQTPYNYEGVQVFSPSGTVDQYLWANVLLTHLDFTQHTIQLGNILKRPVISVVHNSSRYNSIENAVANNFVVYNSKWVGEKLNYKWPSMVFNPPCDWRRYDVCQNPESNQFITMINLDENKGGFLLKRIAEAMPEKKFLAVTGSYSEPNHLGQCTTLPSNVTVLPKQENILPVYQKTRVLLMLSRYESYGMTATEAMSSGIPVICTPTPGLKENCAQAGIYVQGRDELIKGDNGIATNYDKDTYDITPVIKQIRKLDNLKYYRVISDICKNRSRELDPMTKMPELEDFIINAARSMSARPVRERINLI